MANPITRFLKALRRKKRQNSAPKKITAQFERGFVYQPAPKPETNHERVVRQRVRSGRYGKKLR